MSGPGWQFLYFDSLCRVLRNSNQASFTGVLLPRLVQVAVRVLVLLFIFIFLAALLSFPIPLVAW